MSAQQALQQLLAGEGLGLGLGVGPAQGPGAVAGAGAPAARFPPRGLVNTGNSCFINSPLQALLGCAPFCALLAQLKRAAPTLDASKAPTLHGLASLAGDLDVHGTAGAGVPGGSTGAVTPAGSAGADAQGGPRENGSVPEVPGAEAASGGAWSEVPTKGKGKGRAAPLPLGVGSAGAAAGAGHGSHGAHSGAAGSGKDAHGHGHGHGHGSYHHGKEPQPTAQQVYPVLLSSKPLVPSSLNEVIRKFSPQYAAMAAAQANGGPLSMAQKLSLKLGEFGGRDAMKACVADMCRAEQGESLGDRDIHWEPEAWLLQ